MRGLAEIYTVEDIDAFIEEIGRNDFNLLARAEARSYSAAERAADPKLDAMLKALERRAELTEEIGSGRRSPDGTLNVRV